MRNKDVIYISNAATVDATKFLNYLRLIVATVKDPVDAAIAVYALKSAASGTGTIILPTSTTPLTSP